MKLLIIATFVGATVSAFARPHKHAHRHSQHGLVKRMPAGGDVYQPAPVETVIVYVLNGRPISEEDVREGIANGTLIWGDDGNLSTSLAASPTPTPIPVLLPAQNEEQAAPAQTTETLAPSEPSSSSIAPTSVVAEAQSYAPPPAPSSASSTFEPPSTSETPSSSAPAPLANPSDSTDGIDKEFPSGQFSCDSFPLGYGAVPINNTGLGGWIGIQDPQSDGDAGYSDITTIPYGSCTDGQCCKMGAFCSYSCPPGYLKSSWPAKQGATKQSVGGLFCNLEDKLELASGAIAKTLCVKGTDKVTVKVQNNLTVSESICRTDYPGTESMSIPLTTQPGESAELACPDNSIYYHWDNKPTSAQYYINPKGVSEKDACQWGTGQDSTGNWAPVNLGVGFDATSQLAYIGLLPNSPTNPNAILDFNVELIGDGMSGRCKYSNGKYYSGDNYGETVPSGCTVSLKPGCTLTVVLSES